VFNEGYQNVTSQLSIVIPCYNEAKRLPRAQKAIMEFFPRGQSELSEIVLVNDGSSDQTAELMLAWQKIDPRVRILGHTPNRGKGYAIRVGMLAASADWVLFMDADMATPISMWEGFRPLLDQAPVLIGTRKGPGSFILKHQPWLRENMGKVFTALSNIILGLDLTDFTCGFKAFRKDACRAIFLRQTLFDWSYDSEILFLAGHLQFAIREVSVEWLNDDDTKVRLLSATVAAFLGLLKIRFKALQGTYDQLPPVHDS
jgi:glycosyltransferase involved in cell wall biosynthesis